MDAVKFLEEAKRMCNSCACCVDNGKECPIYRFRNGNCIGGVIANITEVDKFPEIVSAIEKWSTTLKTRNSEFLKYYPNADVFESGVANICPKLIDKNHYPSAGCFGTDCYDCKVEYWMQVIE